MKETGLCYYNISSVKSTLCALDQSLMRHLLFLPSVFPSSRQEICLSLVLAFGFVLLLTGEDTSNSIQGLLLAFGQVK